MIEAAVPRMLAPFIELLSVHPPIPRKGKDRFNDPCDGGVLESRLGKMDRFDGRPGNVDAAVYLCDKCGWSTSQRLGRPS